MDYGERMVLAMEREWFWPRRANAREDGERMRERMVRAWEDQLSEGAWMEDGGWKKREDGGWRMEDGRWRMEDRGRGRRMEDGGRGRRMEEGG